MPNTNHNLTADGIDYRVEVHHSGDVIWIYEGSGNRVADAERDTAVEQVFVGYADQEGQIDEAATTAPRSIYDLDWSAQWEEVARWLISTHPNS